MLETRFFVFLKKLLKGKTLAYKPHFIVVDTTMLCNNSCYFCWRKQKPERLKEINQKFKNYQSMPFETFKKIIDDVTQYKSVNWLSLCGPMGEPMMHKEIEKFTTYAFKKNHFKKITINTNGLAIDKHDIGMLMNSVQDFSISVDSIDPETYGKIHGSSEFLPKVIDNIKKCIEYKKQYGGVSKITVRFTENELNIGQFPEFKKFFLDLGVDEINYTKVHSFAGVKKELANRNGAELCCQPYRVLNFTFEGNLTTCCINWQMEPIFGNIKNNTIKELWMNDKMQKWLKTRLDNDPCKNCNGLGIHVQKEGLYNKQN